MPCFAPVSARPVSDIPARIEESSSSSTSSSSLSSSSSSSSSSSTLSSLSSSSSSFSSSSSSEPAGAAYPWKPGRVRPPRIVPIRPQAPASRPQRFAFNASPKVGVCRSTIRVLPLRGVQIGTGAEVVVRSLAQRLRVRPATVEAGAAPQCGLAKQSVGVAQKCRPASLVTEAIISLQPIKAQVGVMHFLRPAAVSAGATVQCGPAFMRSYSLRRLRPAAISLGSSIPVARLRSDLAPRRIWNLRLRRSRDPELEKLILHGGLPLHCLALLKADVTPSSQLDAWNTWLAREEQSFTRRLRQVYIVVGQSITSDLGLTRKESFTVTAARLALQASNFKRLLADQFQYAVRRLVKAGVVVELSLSAPKDLWKENFGSRKQSPRIDAHSVTLPKPLEKAIDGTAKRILSEPYWKQIPTAYEERLLSIIAEDLPPADLAKKLRDFLGSSAATKHAEGIAVTEAGAGLGGGQQLGREVIDHAGHTVEKEWQTMRDGKVRPAHIAAHGQRRKAKQDFLVGGHAAAYPKDPRLPMAQRSRCRCWSTTRVTEKRA